MKSFIKNVCTILSLTGLQPFTASALSDNDTHIVQGALKIYGNDSYTVPFRRAKTITSPRARYPGFLPQNLTLPAGTVRQMGALALPCDIVFERDVAVQLRDGTTIYTDIFRPAGNASVPAIVAWSPYGKEVGGQWLDDIYDRDGIALSATSALEKFEGPDPAYWVAQGYAIVNPDSRGAYSSEGNITYWGRQLAEDGYDVVEWIAAQHWSNAKVGMSGNSWLAVSQWFIAAENPPHLAAIAPWEGLADLYRSTSNRGGIASPSFIEAITTTFAGNEFIEDVARMTLQNQLIDEYWMDKTAELSKITAPAYVVASYTNMLHTLGTFEGYRSISSTNKWLRVHNSSEWPDYYATEHVQELNRFFDHYLKGEDNDWDTTPQIRVSVLDPGHEDTIDRAISSWPPMEMTPTTLYLQSNGTLTQQLDAEASNTSYDITTSGSDSVSFQFTVPDTMEMIGYAKVHLWVEAIGSDDMEISITLQKLDSDGNAFKNMAGGESTSVIAAVENLRVSHRAVDRNLSTLYEPYLHHNTEQPLSAGEIVPIEIALWPMGLRFHAGELLSVTVAATSPGSSEADLGFGTAIVPVPAAGGTFSEGSNSTLIELGGTAATDPGFVNAQRVPTPPSRNNGTHVFHTGGKYDSYILMPTNLTQGDVHARTKCSLRLN